MYRSYAYAKDKERIKCMGTVIVSIDTAPAYTLHPPVIRTYTAKTSPLACHIVND